MWTIHGDPSMQRVLGDHLQPSNTQKIGQLKVNSYFHEMGPAEYDIQAFVASNALNREEKNPRSIQNPPGSYDSSGGIRAGYLRSQSTSAASFHSYGSAHPTALVDSQGRLAAVSSAIVASNDPVRLRKPLANTFRMPVYSDEKERRLMDGSDNVSQGQKLKMMSAGHSPGSFRGRSPSLQQIYATRMLTATAGDRRIPVENKPGETPSLLRLSNTLLNDHRPYVPSKPQNNRPDEDYYLPAVAGPRYDGSLKLYKHPSLQSLQNGENLLGHFTHFRSTKDQRLPQRIICVRHGERVDFAFGGNWAEKAFDHRGNYQRFNLNMPLHLPRRRNPRTDFIGDSPLTELGMFQARLTGEALRHRAMYIHHCYSSPSLRCVQTAHNILRGMGVDNVVPIRIEPGLFEFVGWYERGIPNFLMPAELSANGYNIDLNYKPCIPLERLNPKENYLDFYNRSYKTAASAAELHSKKGCNILLSGHAATLEVCTRQLCGYPPRSYVDFNNVVRRVAYLGLNICEKNYGDGLWCLKEPPIPPLLHTHNPNFDWKVMI